MSAKTSTSPFVPSFGLKYLAIVGNVVVNEGDDLAALRKEVAESKGYVTRTDRYQHQLAASVDFGALTDAQIPTDVVMGKPLMAAVSAYAAWKAMDLRAQNSAAFDAVGSAVALEQARPGTITDEKGIVWSHYLSAGIKLLWPGFPVERLTGNLDFSTARQGLCVAQAAALAVSPHMLGKLSISELDKLAGQL